MARALVLNNYLKLDSPAEPGGVGTIFFRFKPSWNSGDSGFHVLFDYRDGGAATKILTLQKFSNNNLYAGWYSAPTDARIVLADTGLFVNGTWNNWILDWDDTADLIHLYRDNVLVGTGVVSFTAPTGIIGLGIGSVSVGTDIHTGPGDGHGAEFAQWTRVLTAGERTTLQDTGNPSCVSSDLAHYVKILGNDSPEPDEIGTADLVLVGTPAQSTHPTVDSCAADQTITVPLLAAAGTFHEPTVVPGEVTITVPLLAAAGQFFNPTIISDQTITVPLLAAGGSFFTPTVAHVAPKGLTVTINDSLASG